MSLGLTIYPIQFTNLFIPNSIASVFNQLSFKTNTAFLEALKQSNILQLLPPGMQIEYESGEETYITRESSRRGEPWWVEFFAIIKLADKKKPNNLAD